MQKTRFVPRMLMVVSYIYDHKASKGTRTVFLFATDFELNAWKERMADYCDDTMEWSIQYEGAVDLITIPDTPQTVNP